MITLTDLFVFEQTGMDEDKIIGRLHPTGLRPKFMPKLKRPAFRFRLQSSVLANAAVSGHRKLRNFSNYGSDTHSLDRCGACGNPVADRGFHFNLQSRSEMDERLSKYVDRKNLKKPNELPGHRSPTG